MKKTNKKIFGSLGLLLVVAITIFAATLPGPGTSAISSVTDSIIVRVISVSPNVYITEPEDKTTTVDPNQTIKYNYEHIGTLTLELDYKDKDGNTHHYILDTVETGYQAGSGTYNLNLNGPNYGYGDYTVRVSGVGEDSTPVEDIIRFSYHPLTATVKEDSSKKNGDAIVNLNYDTDGDVIKTIEINVYDKNGNLVTPLSPITVTAPGTSAKIPFSKHNLPAGEYTLKITAYDENGEALYPPYELTYNYKPKKSDGGDDGKKEEDIVVPNTADTGGLFKGLNISNTDYLITGLIVFLLAGALGSYYIVKHRRGNKR